MEAAALLVFAALGGVAGWLARGRSQVTLTFSLANTPPPDPEPPPQAVGEAEPVEPTWAFARRSRLRAAGANQEARVES